MVYCVDLSCNLSPIENSFGDCEIRTSDLPSTSLTRYQLSCLDWTNGDEVNLKYIKVLPYQVNILKFENFGNFSDHDPHFEPIIPLPELVQVTTGEEDEEELFGQKSKCFRLLFFYVQC